MQSLLKVAGCLFLPFSILFALLLMFPDKSRKEQRILADILQDPREVEVVFIAVNRRASSVQSTIVGNIKSRRISAIRGAMVDLGKKDQISEFNLTQDLASRGMPGEDARSSGLFPFPSELRMFQQTIAGFDSSIDLYFEPKSGRFVAFVRGGR